MTLDDSESSERVTLAEAYRILEALVVQYNERGESSTVALMTDIEVVGRSTGRLPRVRPKGHRREASNIEPAVQADDPEGGVNVENECAPRRSFRPSST
jgi:hypothetical protein